jgi:hypothetical protein
MSTTPARLKHYVKVVVGNQFKKLLTRQYSQRKGPVRRLISGFSAEANRIGVNKGIVVACTPAKQLTPEFSLKDEVQYRNYFLSSEEPPNRAGVFLARNVELSLPVGMHRINNHTLREVIPSPTVLTNPKYYWDLVSMGFKKKRSMKEGVLLSMPWHHNFYHWMIEILPRLMLYDRQASFQQIPLIVPKSAPKFVSESLRLAGYLSKVIFLEDGVYRFKQLGMLGMLVPTAEVSKEAIGWLNQKFADTHPTKGAKRIYVSRRDAKSRFVSNEANLANLLAEFGFKTLVMSGLSLTDQINAFRSAECIIGPHGAAMANLAFAKSGSTFIEFFNRGHYSNPCFYHIAGVRRLKYGFLVGEPTAIGGVSINPDHLREVLSQALQPQSQKAAAA